MQRSASSPSKGFSRLVSGELFLERSTSQGAEWLPLRFAHNSDGSLSFWSVAQEETVLDADWTRAFCVAPWAPCESRWAQGDRPEFQRCPSISRPFQGFRSCKARE